MKRRGDYDEALSAIVDDCGGYILGTGPRRDARGRLVRAAGGEWDVMAHVPRRVMQGLVLHGMAGRVRGKGAPMPGGLRGVPADPDTLAWAIMERGNGPAELDAWQAVEWFVARVRQVTSTRRETERVEPEPDPLPARCEAWLERMVCPAKRAYALDAARSVYWPSWPAPPDTGAAWEAKVWRKLGNRHVAEAARAER